MRKIYLFLLLFITSTAFSQTNFTGPKDALLKSNMDEYLRLIKKVDTYKVKTENELQEINYLKTQANLYIDSAKIISKKAKRNISDTAVYIQKFSCFIGFSSTYIRKVDSALTIASAYKDSALVNNKVANDFNIKIQDDKEEINGPAINLNYVVQLGAGNMDIKYFDKVEKVKVVKSNDGIKRFIVGLFNTKNEAMAFKEKMIRLGYSDAIVRTIDSLYN
jgi:hypothetical protein